METSPTRRALGGALAGAGAAMLWAVQQPLDKRVFRCGYDDVELLGKLATRGPAWPTAGLAMHAGNGAVFGAVYALARARLPGPPLAQALAAAMAENFALWPLGRLTDRFHPARAELEPLTGNRRALAQATWRHLLFGLALGVIEARLNGRIPSAERPATTGRHA
jgi:hypothetical protein